MGKKNNSGKSNSGRGKSDKGNAGRSKWITGCKERGEWAELCFMARARGEGMAVLKPYGDSRPYDVAVEDGRKILRVQVKSTIYCRRGGEYSLSVTGQKRKRYPKGSVDFFAVFVIPLDEWYIIPYKAMGRRLTLHFTPGSKRSKWTPYLEAWDLLRVIEIQACVDPEVDGGWGGECEVIRR
jgi:PD-(D/E)XK endonuclease